MFPRMRLLFPQRHISLLYLKEKIVLSNKKAPAGDNGYFCMSYCGKHFISTRNEIIKSSIQAALPFLSIPIPLYRLNEIHSKNASPVFLYMEKPIPSIRHPAGNPAGLHQLKKLFQFFLGTFIIIILKSLSPDYHACLPAVFSIQTNKVLGAPTQRAAV